MEKIDGVVACVMALDGAIRRPDQEIKAGVVIIDTLTGTVTRNGKVINELGPRKPHWTDYY